MSITIPPDALLILPLMCSVAFVGGFAAGAWWMGRTILRAMERGDG